jgi:hypothetical protein
MNRAAEQIRNAEPKIEISAVLPKDIYLVWEIY